MSCSAVISEKVANKNKLRAVIIEAGNCACCGKHIDDNGLFLCEECRRTDEHDSIGEAVNDWNRRADNEN